MSDFTCPSEIQCFYPTYTFFLNCSFVRCERGLVLPDLLNTKMDGEAKTTTTKKKKHKVINSLHSG